MAELYRDFLNVLLLDTLDARTAPSIERIGIRAVVGDTVMTSLASKKALARLVLRGLGMR